MNTYEDNIALIADLDVPNGLDQSRDAFAADFTWTYINPLLPDLDGTYHGLDGFKRFFDELGQLTDNTFSVEKAAIRALGPELVIVDAKPSMVIGGQAIETDAAVVWRIRDGRLAGAWDIPALYQGVRIATAA